MSNNGKLAKAFVHAHDVDVVGGFLWLLLTAVGIDLFCCCGCCGCSFYLVRSEPSGRMEQLIGFDNVAAHNNPFHSIYNLHFINTSPYK